MFSPFSAEALQSLILLNGQKEMYEKYKGDFKVDEIRWTPEKAKSIVDEWERQFTKVRLGPCDYHVICRLCPCDTKL